MHHFNLKSASCLNNQSVLTASTSLLKRLRKKNHIRVPNEQRIVDRQKVEEIVRAQTLIRARHGAYCFMPPINLHYVKEHRSLYLVDGQHRLEAMLDLHARNKRAVKCQVLLVEVDTYQDMISNFNMINLNTRMPQLPPSSDKDVLASAVRDLQSRYPRAFSRAKRTRRPWVDFSTFTEALAHMYAEMSRANKRPPGVEDLVSCVEKANAAVRSWVPEDCSRRIDSNPRILWSSHREACAGRMGGFFLGLFPRTDEDHRYGWVPLALGGPGSEVEPARKRLRIPDQVRAAMIFEYVGDKMVVPCFVCRKVFPIVGRMIHAGHMIADKHGGPPTVENLRPACATCNGSMGTHRMTDYIRKYFPENLMLIDGRSTKYNALDWCRRWDAARPPTSSS